MHGQVMPSPGEHRQAAGDVAQRMQRDIVEHERLLRRSAEEQIDEWRALLEWVASLLDSEGLDRLVKQRKALQTPREWRRFLQKVWRRMDQARLWGFPYEEGVQLRGENEELQQQVSSLKQQKLVMQQELLERGRHIETLELETGTLRARLAQTIAAAAARTSGGQPTPDSDPAGATTPPPTAAPAACTSSTASDAPPPPSPLVPAAPAVSMPDTPEFRRNRKWPKPLRGDRDAHLLWLIGAKGWSLRTRLAAAQAVFISGKGGQVKSTSGSLKRQFQYLDGTGRDALRAPLLERERTIVGRMNLIAYGLSDAGRDLYRRLFGVDAVESEWERLRRMHQGGVQTKHTGLVLLAAFYAEQYLTEGMTLICPPPPLEGTEPDLYIAWAGGTVYAEAERSTYRKAWSEAKVHKWQRQVLYQGAVAAVVPNEEGRRMLLAQIHASVPSGTPIWMTDLEYLQSSYNRVCEIRKAQGLGRRAIPNDGVAGATWFWAVRPRMPEG